MRHAKTGEDVIDEWQGSVSESPSLCRKRFILEDSDFLFATVRLFQLFPNHFNLITIDRLLYQNKSVDFLEYCISTTP